MQAQLPYCNYLRVEWCTQSFANIAARLCPRIKIINVTKEEIAAKTMHLQARWDRARPNELHPQNPLCEASGSANPGLQCQQYFHLPQLFATDNTNVQVRFSRARDSTQGAESRGLYSCQLHQQGNKPVLRRPDREIWRLGILSQFSLRHKLIQNKVCIPRQRRQSVDCFWTNPAEVALPYMYKQRTLPVPFSSKCDTMTLYAIDFLPMLAYNSW